MAEEQNTPKIGVIGLGYVGLPLLVEIGKSGLLAVGIDINERKVDSINAGDNYIDDVDGAELRRLVAAGIIRATTDYAVISQLDAICICVPTPLRKTKDPDVSHIVEAVDQIATRLRSGQIVILESTTYPGTTEELLKPRLEESGLQAGRDFYLAFSPERVDPGNKNFKTRNTPKIIGGFTPECTRRAADLYARIFDTVIPVSTCTCAEMVKLLENTFRSVNIGLVNEVALMCDKLKLDVWEVINAAATKPFGFMPFYPGPGLGGHCIPVDPHYLAWKLRTLNYTARFIELASEVNSFMPHFVVDKIVRALNDDRKPINGSRILVLGLAYKADVDDVRESPAIDIIALLRELKAHISYHDPLVSRLCEGEFEMESIELTAKALSECDCAVLVTNHHAVDYQLVLDHAPLLIDTRNAVQGMSGRARVVRL